LCEWNIMKRCAEDAQLTTGLVHTFDLLESIINKNNFLRAFGKVREDLL